MTPYPAVVTDRDWSGILNIVSPTCDFSLMGGREYRHVGAHHNTVSNCNDGTVKDDKIEVSIKSLAYTDVAAVVNIERRLDDDIVAIYPAEDLAQHLCSSLLQGSCIGLGTGGKEMVILMSPGSGTEASIAQLWHE